MKTAWLKLVFGFMACFFLTYGICFAQTDSEGTQTGSAVESQPATPEEPPAAPAVTSPETKAGELPPPLTAEMTVAEHWSKNPYPRSVSAGSRLHIVERGDTLWDLANRYYNNPFLWPQIWDANKYIPNAHWIYPGDPIVIPPLSPVSEEQIAGTPTEQVGPGGEVTGEEQGGPGTPSLAAPEAKRYPIALDTDLYCSGFIVKDTGAWKLSILGSEEGIQKVALTLFDVVYINQGEAEGISPGDEFTVLHPIRSIEHPITLAPLGEYIIQTGRIKVVATQEHTATAQITFSCDATSIGDYLVPFEPKEVPLLSDLPPVDRFSQEGPNTKGYIVFTKDDVQSVGQESEVQVDLGAKDGVAPGTRLIVYRSDRKTYDSAGLRHDLPRKVLGEIVIFNVQDTTSTGRIIQMYDFAAPGDKVEVR